MPEIGDFPSPSQGQWEAHENQRQYLVGPMSELWACAPRLALILSASIPSGVPEIVRLRSCLEEGMFGDGILPGALAQVTSDTTVTVVHRPPNSPPPAHEFIYVGEGDDVLHPTPWSCPFVGQTLTRDRCANYIASRADSRYWLALLHGACLL